MGCRPPTTSSTPRSCQRGAVGGHLEQHLERQHEGLCARDRQLGRPPLPAASEVASVGREANTALTAQVNASTSQAAGQQALSNGLATLAATVSDSSSAPRRRGRRRTAIRPRRCWPICRARSTTYDASPSSSSAAQGLSPPPHDLASSLNSGAAAVQTGARAGRLRHGFVGRHRSIRCSTSSLGQRDDRLRHCDRRQRRQRRGYAQQHPHSALAADRHFDRRAIQTGRRRSTPIAA